jgi:hypothetical protein
VLATGVPGMLAAALFGVLTAAIFGVRRVVGMGGVFAGVFLVVARIIRVVFMGIPVGRGGRNFCRIGLADRLRRLAFVSMILPAIGVVVPVMRVVMFMGVLVMIMMGGVVMMPGLIGVMVAVVIGVRTFMRRRGKRRIGTGVLDDFALDALAIAAAARIAVARAATAAGAVFALLLGLAMGAFVRLDQRLAIGDRNLVIVRMDFAEGQEAVAVAAIFNEGRLQRRFYPRNLGEIDVAAQLLALSGLEIKFFDAIAADHNDPGLFRVGSIDQHFVGHFGTLDGGARVSR